MYVCVTEDYLEYHFQKYAFCDSDQVVLSSYLEILTNRKKLI